MTWKSLIRIGLSIFLAWSLGSACTSKGAGTDSNTHWVTCSTVADCPSDGTYQCVGGRCVRASAVDSGSPAATGVCPNDVGPNVPCDGALSSCRTACVDGSNFWTSWTCTNGHWVGTLGLNPCNSDASAPGNGGGSGGAEGASNSSHAGGSPVDGSVRDRDAKDASVEFFLGDAGPAPPPYCVAPCVWDVVKHCIPTFETCVTNDDAGPIIGMDSVTCDPSTGWAQYAGLVGTKQSRTVVSRYGETCFEWDFDYGLIPVSSLSDHSGHTAAMAIQYTVYCGATPSDLSTIVNNHQRPTDGGVALADGGFARVYELDLTRPECAAWQDIGLPVAPPCKTKTAGVCPQ